MPQHTPDQIVTMVDQMEQGRSDLHQRMDHDMSLYHLEPYAGEMDENGNDRLAGYKHFTSNDPRTVMDLALHLGSTSRRIVRVHQPRAQRVQREIDNMKEMFSLGVMAAADERRANRLEPPLQDAVFSQSLFRGRTAQRALLVKENVPIDPSTELQDQRMVEMGMNGLLPARQRTRTYVDVQDWDPRNTYWRVGKHGLVWACHKEMKTRQAIIDEYGVDPDVDALELGPQEDGANPADPEEDFGREYAVYDFFDDTHNTVVVEGSQSVSSSGEGRALKPPTPHGMGRVPVAIAIAESRPQFQTGSDGYDAHYGESFYKADRGVFNEQNFMYSIMAELSQRSISQPLLIRSKDGSLTLPEGDPRVSGEETSLSTDNEEDILPLPPMEVVKEYGPFMGIISSMMQRGSFPSSAFGELQFQLSGFAITQLRQGLEAPLTPHIRAAESTMKQVLDILADAYASGQFDTMELSGRLQDPQRSYFSQEILPERVRQGGGIEVELVAQLPQDDQSRMGLAQMAREGPVPMMDDRFIREHILQIQDVEQVERAVWEQAAERSSPAALAFRSMMAAAQQGERELAEIWSQEFQMAMMTKFLQMMQLMMMGGGQGGGGENGGGGQGTPSRASNPRPSTLPPEAMGIFSEPNRQAGPNTAPGTPRPGARSRTNLGNIFDPSVL